MLNNINTKEQYLLHLLSCVLKGKKPDEKPDEISWYEIFEFATMHNVANIACSGIERLFRKPCDDLWRRWKEIRNKAGIDDVTFKAEQRKVGILLSEEEIRCLPLNGKWIKDLYPGTDMRFMSVLDILIDRENENKVHDILVVDGFICEQQGSGAYDLYRKQPIIDVDVYHALPPGKNKAICGSYEECFLYASPIQGRPYVYEMPIEEAYVYYISDLNRKYSMGIGIQPIMDIYLIWKNYTKTWDKEKIQKHLSEMDLSGFEHDMREVAEYWFGDGEASERCLKNEKRILDTHRRNAFKEYAESCSMIDERNYEFFQTNIEKGITKRKRMEIMDKRIKTPMIIGIVLQGLAFVIAFGCYLLQGSMTSMQNIKIGEKVFPDTLITIAVLFLIHIIALLVMQTYEGESRRLIGAVLAAAYCVVNVASPMISRITMIFESRKGVEFVAAKNVLTSMISLFTSPLNLVSLVLVMIAVGRYGVLDKEQS